MGFNSVFKGLMQEPEMAFSNGHLKNKHLGRGGIKHKKVAA